MRVLDRPDRALLRTVRLVISWAGTDRRVRCTRASGSQGCGRPLTPQPIKRKATAARLMIARLLVVKDLLFPRLAGALLGLAMLIERVAL